MVKILIVDVETAPALVWVWKFWKENVAPKQVVENPYMLSWAAKWFGDDKVYYEDKEHQNEKEMLLPLAALLDEADIVVAHNAIKFDIPTMNARFLINGIRPPSPYKVVDTLAVAKKEFRFPSNSLEYLSEALNLPIKKGGHKKFPGFTLWLEVLRNNPEAWAEMKTYNVDDILTLEALYIRLRPYMRFHPNVAVFEDNGEDHVCPKCGSKHVQRRGFAYTNVGKYQRFQCNGCGGWSRSRLREKGHNVNGINVVN